jgi:hypothetical protein
VGVIEGKNTVLIRGHEGKGAANCRFYCSGFMKFEVLPRRSSREVIKKLQLQRAGAIG